jgi:hypothetical protein
MLILQNRGYFFIHEVMNIDDVMMTWLIFFYHEISSCQVPEKTTYYYKMLLRDVKINFKAMVSQSDLSRETTTKGATKEDLYNVERLNTRRRIAAVSNVIDHNACNKMPPRQCIIMILLILWEKKNWFSTNTDFFLRINIPALFPGNKIVGKWSFFFLQFSLKRGTWHMWSWMLTSWSLFITFMYTCSNVCDILKSWMKYIKKKKSN